MGQICHSASPCCVVNLCLRDKQCHLQKTLPSAVSVNDFEFGRVIGRGSFAYVVLAKLNSSQHPLAIKVLNKAKIVLNQQTQQVFIEKEILSRLNSPFIVDFLGTMQDEENLYCIMEYIPGGELFRYMCRKNRLTRTEARFYITEIVVAVEYVHSQGCIYRDIKPENIMIRSSGHIKLTDFGLGKIMEDGEKTFTVCGTPEFLAPELIDKSGHNAAADWWQLGILLFEMLASHTPFTDPSPYKLYENILTKVPVYPPELFAPPLKSLLQGLLCKDPEARLKYPDIAAHQYFEGTDWEAVRKLKLTPPFRPHLSNSFDTSHFEDFEDVSTPSSTHLQHSFESVFQDY